MKVVFQINKNDNGKRMLEFTDLCVTKKELIYSGSGTVYGYAVSIKYQNSDDNYYEKSFTTYQYSGTYRDGKTPAQIANEECNKCIDTIIQKIQDAVSKAKKRHSDFTEVIELD